MKRERLQLALNKPVYRIAQEDKPVWKNPNDDPDLTVNKTKRRKRMSANNTRFAQMHDMISHKLNQKLLKEGKTGRN